ncbi:MAG: hypothetical protein ACYSUF_14700 [Planctomycetota bacterium]|jgi:hypothetical protein
MRGGGHELTLGEDDVTGIGIPFNDIDVTDQVPPDLRMGEGADPGPAPVELFNAPIVFPEPPAPTCLAALLLISLDADGDVGITDFLQMLAAGDTSPIGPPDADGDGTVGIGDFLAMLANRSPCPE